MEVDLAPSSGGPPLTFFERVYDGYVRLLQYVTGFFRRLNLDSIGDPLVSFLAEPISTLISGYYFWIGQVSVDQFHYHGANPTDLGAVEVNDIAILLIHGAGSNHGLWKPLAKKIEAAKVGAIFTMKMPKVGTLCKYEREVQQVEKDALKDRITEITQLYLDQGKRAPKFVIVGHSRGGDAGIEMCSEVKDIAKVIRLGKMTPGSELGKYCVDKLFEVRAAFDAICHWESCLSADHQTTIKTGHLGLMYSDAAHQKVIQIVQSVMDK